MALILIFYIGGYVACLKILPGEITVREIFAVGGITLISQLVFVWAINLAGGNIVLIYLMSVEMVIAIFFFALKRRLLTHLPSILLAFLLLALGTQLSQLGLFEVFGVPYIVQESQFWLIGINTVLTIGFAIGIAWLITLGYQKWALESMIQAKSDFVKLSSLMLSMIILFFGMSMLDSRSNQSTSSVLIANSSMLMLTIALTCGGFLVAWFNRKRVQERLNYERIINGQLKHYLEALEKIENDQRQFRHDFINIYGSLAGYIENNDLVGLKKYYYQEVAQINAEQNRKSFQLKSLANLKVIELKGLLSLKLTQASSLGVKMNIEIIQPVVEVWTKVFDFNRCLGILVDNALEEAAQNQVAKRQVTVVLLSEPTMLTLMVRNQLNHPVVIDQIFQPGYSTKDAKRGLGLPEVERIVNNTANMTLTTDIVDGWLTQKIMILKRA